jgi:hypothetical protein
MRPIATAIRPAPGDVCLRRASAFAVNPELMQRHATPAAPPALNPSSRDLSAAAFPGLRLRPTGLRAVPRSCPSRPPPSPPTKSLFAAPSQHRQTRARSAHPRAAAEAPRQIDSAANSQTRLAIRPDGNRLIIAHMVRTPKLFICMAYNMFFGIIPMGGGWLPPVRQSKRVIFAHAKRLRLAPNRRRNRAVSDHKGV